MDKRSNIVNLIILGVAIILVCVTKKKFSELFVANIPMMNGPMMNGQEPLREFANSGHPQGNPYTYQNQIYPAKIPYYPELGSPCKNGDCGLLGKCEGGSCRAIPYNKTVFNQPII